MINREIIAKYLKQWRKTYDIKKTSDFFGHGTTKTVKILRSSQVYLKSSKRKSKIYRYLKIKNHPIRNKIAKYLRDWKNGKTAEEIAAKYETDKKTVLHYLALSEQYTSSTKLLSDDQQMTTKGSPFRRKLAFVLNAWRKNRNIIKTAKISGYKKGVCQLWLSKSKAYQRNIDVLWRNINDKSDIRLILRWAKKTKLVNILGGKCCDCGNNDIIVLEFHHPNDDKESGVGDLLESSFTEAMAEAAKCILLCRNCHIRRHTKIDDIERLKDVIKHKSVRL